MLKIAMVGNAVVGLSLNPLACDITANRASVIAGENIPSALAIFLLL